MKSGEIISNRQLHGDYFRIDFRAPEIAGHAEPGQFVHVRIDQRADNMLRRPFSIFNAEDGVLSIVYKVVGVGTRRLSQLRPGPVCDIIGPRGRGFSAPPAGVIPVAVCGGYGSAALYMMTRRGRGVLLLGARNAQEVILANEYAEAGFEVRIATNDGSLGTRGFVTELIEPLLAENPAGRFFFYGCGPGPMLRALAIKLRSLGLDGELSVDEIMCCGVGACFGCVVKVNDREAETGWSYARSCVEGPVFRLDEIYIDGEGEC